MVHYDVYEQLARNVNVLYTYNVLYFFDRSFYTSIIEHAEGLAFELCVRYTYEITVHGVWNYINNIPQIKYNMLLNNDDILLE